MWWLVTPGDMLRARCATRAMQRAADSAGLDRLAAVLERFGVRDRLSARWMADDFGERCGWAPALNMSAELGDFPSFPAPLSPALYVKELQRNVRPGFRPNRPKLEIWDCHPLDPALAHKRRVLAFVGLQSGRMFSYLKRLTPCDYIEGRLALAAQPEFGGDVYLTMYSRDDPTWADALIASSHGGLVVVQVVRSDGWLPSAATSVVELGKEVIDGVVVEAGPLRGIQHRPGQPGIRTLSIGQDHRSPSITFDPRQ